MMPESDPLLVADRSLDARAWLCPRPVIEARQWLDSMTPGLLLEVLLSDPHGPLDFQVLCQRKHYQLHTIETVEQGGQRQWRIILSKPKPPAAVAERTDT
jgi:TusA-related sulfurtransferase